MRVVEIYVERLKSYGDYSNRKVGLRAILDEGEDLREAYLKLAGECESLLEIKEIEARREAVEQQLKYYEERRRELEKAREEFEQIRSELSKSLRDLIETLEKIERLAEEKQLKLSEKIIEKLRSIRRALGYYDCDP